MSVTSFCSPHKETEQRTIMLSWWCDMSPPLLGEMLIFALLFHKIVEFCTSKYQEWLQDFIRFVQTAVQKVTRSQQLKINCHEQKQTFQRMKWMTQKSQDRIWDCIFFFCSSTSRLCYRGAATDRAWGRRLAPPRCCQLGLWSCGWMLSSIHNNTRFKCDARRGERNAGVMLEVGVVDHNIMRGLLMWSPPAYFNVRRSVLLWRMFTCEYSGLRNTQRGCLTFKSRNKSRSESSCRRVTYSAYPVAHGNLLVSFRMRMGRAMWSAEHSISSGDSPRNWGLIYGNFSGRSDPVLPPPPELPPAMIPPMNPATADLTRVSILVARRGGASVGLCAAPPRLPFPGLPPSLAALVDGSLDGEEEAEEEEQTLRWSKVHSFRAEWTAAAGGWMTKTAVMLYK